MRGRVTASLALTIFFAFAAPAWAIGTPAGTDITNTATASYTVSGTPVSVTSNTDTVTVDELVDVDVTLQNAGPVLVSPGDTDQVLTFLVTNIGNGIETFTLAPLSVLGGDDFDPTLVNAVLDTNGNGTYDAGVDTVYAAGVNDPTLDANTVGSESITVFVLNDIPLGPVDGDRGDSQLTATSNTGAGAPGTSFAGGGDGGTDAIVGPSGGSDVDVGAYLVSTLAVSVVKSAAISDPFGGTAPVPGATVTYSLVVTVAGSGTAESVTITDPIPSNTTYAAGALTLNGAPLTDGADADAGDFNVTNPGEITVDLGDLTSASPAQTITFDVTID
jgi:uncharacterized repeat protein (TIGR01451 family)